MKNLFLFSIIYFFNPIIISKADTFTPSYYCSRPYGSYTDYSVNSYRQCIQSFIDEQNSAVKKHSQAARDAVNEWNSFVRTHNY